MQVFKIVYIIVFVTFLFTGYVKVNGTVYSRKNCSFLSWLVIDALASAFVAVIISLPILGVMYLFAG